MPLELGVWRIDEGRASKVDFGPLDLERRLQDILEHDIAIASPSWFVIGKEVPTSFGKRIDLLAINANGDLIVIELKKGRTEREVIAQLLDYGSWVSDLRADKIAEIYSAYCLKSDTSRNGDLESAFRARFGVGSLPEEVNSAHDLVVVGTDFDASTERIADYLSGRGVRINAIFFNVFKDGEREYLTRAWLKDPTEVELVANSASKAEWNGEYYVNFGHDDRRHWEDARRYGFVAGGGGRWYSNTLKLLSKDDRIWVNVPGPTGYVGVGIVTSERVPAKDFEVPDENGKSVPLLTLPLLQPNMNADKDDPEMCEYVVGVRWLQTRPLDDAIYEAGFFGNQNTVARPVSPKWNHTVNVLRQRFDIPQD